MSNQLSAQPSSLSMQDQAKAESLNFGTDMVKMIEVLLEDDKAAETLKRGDMTEIWAPIMKSMKLTFLSETDADILREYFEEAVCNLMLQRRRGEFTHADSMNIMMLRMLFYANLNRSVGTADNKINERIAQLTTITHQTGKFKEETTSGGGRNILGKLFGMGGK